MKQKSDIWCQNRIYSPVHGFKMTENNLRFRYISSNLPLHAQIYMSIIIILFIHFSSFYHLYLHAYYSNIYFLFVLYLGV